MSIVALHCIAARLRFLLNLKGRGWAARGDREREPASFEIEREPFEL